MEKTIIFVGNDESLINEVKGVLPIKNDFQFVKMKEEELRLNILSGNKKPYLVLIESEINDMSPLFLTEQIYKKNRLIRTVLFTSREEMKHYMGVLRKGAFLVIKDDDMREVLQEYMDGLVN